MKKYLSALAALALLFACTPEDATTGTDNTGDNTGGNTGSTVVELTGITLSEHDITLEVGANKVLEVTFTPEDATNKEVTWESSDPSVATVTDGIVVGVAPGTTEVVAKSGSLTDKCTVTVVLHATSISLDLTEVTLAPEETATLTATVLPANTTDALEWSSSDEAVATVADGLVTAKARGETTITAKTGEQSATCKVTVKNPIPDGAVDLGLSVYWATCNVGASVPEEYGYYYAWGETETKEKNSWETYKWLFVIEYATLTKYNTDSSYGTVDNKTVLDPEDDVAHVKLGGNWRMPTSSEVDELMSTRNNSNYQWEWKSLNGHNGWLVTYLVNNSSIFLPAAGYRYDTYLGDVGSDGGFWSSSLYTVYPYGAWSVYFGSGGVYRYHLSRCDGFSVRPVSE